MNRSEQAGENLVIVIIIAILFMELVVLLPLNLSVAREELPTQGVRLVLTFVLLFFLYRGHKWARWLSAVLFVLGGIVGILMVAAFATFELGTPFTVIMLIGAGISFWAAGVVFFSSNVKAFLAKQRGDRIVQPASAAQAESLMGIERTGEKLIVGIITATLLLSASAIAAHNLAASAERLPTQVIAFLISCVLCFFLYKGREWARWVCVVVFSFAAIRGISAISSLGVDVRNPFLATALVATAFYASAAVMLIFSSKIKAFFAWRKTQRTSQQIPIQGEVH